MLYTIGHMSYKGEKTPSGCQQQMMLGNIDCVATAPDLGIDTGCEKDYCYVHYTSNNCNYESKDFRPSGSNAWSYRSTIKSDGQCQASVDNVVFSDAYFADSPDPTNCPNSVFCFLELINQNTQNDNTNSETNSSNGMNNDIDLNSTTSENQAPLQAQNTTNKHLQDLKDKSDNLNMSLKDIKDSNDNLLLSSQDMKQSLDKLNLSSEKSLQNQLQAMSNSDKLQNSMNSLNTKSLANNSLLKEISSNTNDTNIKLDKTNELLEEGLFSNLDPFADVDFEDDGSSTFDDLETESKNAIGITYEEDLFGLAQAGSSGLQTVSFSFYGNTMTIFEPSMLSSFPMVEIRAMFMFLFALAGFIVVFKTI